MITIDEIELLATEQMRKVVAENIDNDPIKIALSKKIEHANLVASQVKYLQRAKTKLASYYQAQCIIPSLAFEQSSSEHCAAHKNQTGELCIDLTCGLGVDSLYLSRRFNRVITIEQNPTLAHLARMNFRLLGATNIEVICSSAEEFLSLNTDLISDLIYCDPDRRGNNGEKLFKLEDCSPNIVGLLPQLREISKQIVVKCSPLMDVDQAFRLFGNNSAVEVVSLGGECKEVIVSTSENIKQQTITATALDIGTVVMNVRREPARSIEPTEGDEYRYLIVPDVALQKARLARECFTRQGVYITSDNGYGFSITPPHDTIGKVFEIEHIESYSIKSLKKSLKEMGIKKATILKRDFPFATQKIIKELSIAEGGTTKIAFTTFNNTLLAVFLR